ncbi:MAG: MerR family transcriptional regulator [Lachnospiraceae bacterium]|nr:MerR family transcriptional regulator [Lachnospiraceae bacterium]
MKQTYTIGELAQLAGVSAKTLRVYEMKGLLLPERNKENRYRSYTEEAVRRLEQIQLMKYLGFSLEQIAVFLSQYETAGREELLLAQKRLLERKRAQLDSVIACVERAVEECKGNEMDTNSFLQSLGSIVKNQKADELVWRLMKHSYEPRGWSEFIFEQAGLTEGMCVLDAGAGYGNLWRYNLSRLPKKLRVTCIDRHNTHADDFFEYVKEKENAKELAKGQISFVWNDLELIKISEKYHCIFFNHVASFIQDRRKLYRRFYDSLKENGKLICTWGGLLLFENVTGLLGDFLEDTTPLDAKYKKQVSVLRQYETELYDIFGKVEQRTYLTKLHFATAEEYMDYILQVCKPVEAELEQRRNEFLAFLQSRKKGNGQYEFVRDTYLYCCGREEM